MSAESPRITELRRRVENDPASIAFAQLAEEYRRAGNYESAERWCRIGLQRHPAYLSARVTLGRTLIELNKLDEAEHELQHVLTAAPDNLAALKGVAEIHQRLDKSDTALEYYRRALALSRHDPELEEIVDRLGKASAPSAPPPAAGETLDFDTLLDSLGIRDRAAPPLVEALLDESSTFQPPMAVVDEPVAIITESDTPEPDWMTGPLPDFPDLNASFPDETAAVREAVPASLDAADGRPETPEAPRALEAPEAPEAPKALEAPEALEAPQAPAALEAPEAPEAPQASAPPDTPPGDRDRLILGELEAWLDAIKR